MPQLTDEDLEYLAQTFFARLLGSKTGAHTDDEDCSKLLLCSALEQAMAQDAQIPSEPLHSSDRRSSGPSGALRRLDSRVKMTRSQIYSLYRKCVVEGTRMAVRVAVS